MTQRTIYGITVKHRRSFWQAVITDTLFVVALLAVATADTWSAWGWK